MTFLKKVKRFISPAMCFGCALIGVIILCSSIGTFISADDWGDVACSAVLFLASILLMFAGLGSILLQFDFLLTDYDDE